MRVSGRPSFGAAIETEVRNRRPREVRGVEAVVRQAMVYRHLASGARRALVNGSAGVVVFAAGRPFAVVSVTF